MTERLSSVCSQLSAGHRREDYARGGLPVFRNLVVHLEVVWAVALGPWLLVSQSQSSTMTLQEGLRKSRTPLRFCVYSMRYTESWFVAIDLLGVCHLSPWRIWGTQTPRFMLDKAAA